MRPRRQAHRRTGRAVPGETAPLLIMAATQRVQGTGPSLTGSITLTGTPEVGETLTCPTGTWSGTGTITYAYQWKRDGSPIGGATASTYTLVAGDDETGVSCEVTATDDNGSTAGSSNAVSVTYPAASVTASDSLSVRTLTITVDSISAGAVASLSLLTLDSVDVLADATGTGPWTYVVPSGVASQTVAWTVTATSSGGTDTASGSEVVAADLFTSVGFGALTLAGAGGLALPSGATSISSAGVTNLVVSTGFVVPDTGGTVTSGTVVFNNGTEWTVTAAANEYSARSKTEMEAAVSAAGATTGKTVRMRPGAYDGSRYGFFYDLSPTNVVTLTTDDRDTTTVSEGFIEAASNLIVDNWTSTAASGDLMVVIGTCTNIVVQNCHIHGSTPIDLDGDYSVVAPTAPTNGIWVNKNEGTLTDIFLYNNTIHDVLTGIGGGSDAGTYAVEGNSISEIYGDCISVSSHGASATLILDNYLAGIIGASTDGANPHSDFVQFNATTADWPGIQIKRNVVLHKYHRATPQIFFVSNIPVGYFYDGIEICGNLAVSKGYGSAGINVNRVRNGVFIGNTVVTHPDAPGPALGVGLRIGESETAGTHIIKNNAADSINLWGTYISDNNVVLGVVGATVSYATAFAGPTYAPTSRAEALTMFAMKANGPLDADNSGTASLDDIGAAGTGYVTWASQNPGRGGSLDGSYGTTVPLAFEAEDFSVATGSAEAEIDLTIQALPSNGGSAITDVEYDVGASGTWISVPSYSGTGTYTLTMASASTSYSIRLRAVNAQGNGPASVGESATSGAAAPSGVSLTFLSSHVDAVDRTTYTFSSITLGALTSADFYVVCVSHRAGSAQAAPAVTVDGQSTTAVVENPAAATNQRVDYFVTAKGATIGASGNVVVTLSAATSRLGISIWKVSGAASNVPSDTDIDGPSASATPTMSVNAPANSAAITAICATGTYTSSTSANSGTSLYDESIESTVNHAGFGAEIASADATWDPDVTVGTATNVSVSVAVWGP